MVTKVQMPYLNIIWTHLMEAECLEVNGAAMQASPNLKFNSPSKINMFCCCSLNCYILIRGSGERAARSFFFLSFLSLIYCSVSSLVPTSAIPRSDFFRAPTSFVPSPHISMHDPPFFRFVTINSF